jgi:hypothetical protein
MGPIEILLLWFVVAVCVGIVAGGRGRSGFGWFLLAAFVSPLIAGIALVALPNVRRDREQAEAAERRHREQLDAIVTSKSALTGRLVIAEPKPADPIGTIGLLAELRETGAISDDDFDTKKRDLLSRV